MSTKQDIIAQELVERLSSIWPELADTFEAVTDGDDSEQDPVYAFVVKRCNEIAAESQNPDRAYKKLLASLKQAASDLQELVKLAN